MGRRCGEGVQEGSALSFGGFAGGWEDFTSFETSRIGQGPPSRHGKRQARPAAIVLAA